MQAAEEVGACIFVHPWDMQRDGRMSKFWLPWLVGMPSETAVAICSMAFGGVFERFPKLRVCFAHGGQFYDLYGAILIIGLQEELFLIWLVEWNMAIMCDLICVQLKTHLIPGELVLPYKESFNLGELFTG